MLPDGTALGSRSDIINGIPAGVQIRSGNYAKFAVQLTLALNVEEDKEKKFYSFLKAQIGKPYNKLGILGIAVGQDWNSVNSFFCSQLAVAALIQSGICPSLIAPTNRINPDTLAVVVSALGGYIEK